MGNRLDKGSRTGGSDGGTCSLLEESSQGRLTRNDELASARRVYSHYNGLSGSGILRKDLSDKCLRDKLSEKEQAELSLKTVTQSLRRIRKQSWLA